MRGVSMNISKFTVLGALELIQSGSGYDILNILEKKKISRWTEVKKGSIYFAIKQLLKDEHIKNIGEIKDSAYPARTIYQITDKGRQLFDDLQEEAFNGLYPSFYGFKLGLKFNIRKSPEEIIYFAKKAVTVIDEVLNNMTQYMDYEMEDPNDAFFIKHDQMIYKQERKWIELVIEKYSN